MEQRRYKAFTLIEMMAVVVIIGILAAVVAPKFFGQVDRAKVVRVSKDIDTIKQAITLYRFNTGQWPEELRDLAKEPDGVTGWNGPYVENGKFRDPWDNKYEYRLPGNDGRDFDIWSYGQDGKEGGEGDDADITSWSDDED